MCFVGDVALPTGLLSYVAREQDGTPAQKKKCSHRFEFIIWERVLLIINNLGVYRTPARRISSTRCIEECKYQPSFLITLFLTINSCRGTVALR